jgi:hypothetical protein
MFGFTLISAALAGMASGSNKCLGNGLAVISSTQRPEQGYFLSNYALYLLDITISFEVQL